MESVSSNVAAPQPNRQHSRTMRLDILPDAVSAGLITHDDIPKETHFLGLNSKERINIMITSICRVSGGHNFVDMEEDVKHATELLRDFMFQRVYLTSEAKSEESKADRMLTTMYEYFCKKVEALPPFYISLLERFPLETVVCDYISSMTDRYAVYMFDSIFIPKSFILR